VPCCAGLRAVLCKIRAVLDPYRARSVLCRPRAALCRIRAVPCRAVPAPRSGCAAEPDGEHYQGLAKSWVQKGTPRESYATATPTLRNRQLRMLARWPGLFIHAFMTVRASGWPQAMFSP
jgi:hypothetical protein